MRFLKTEEISCRRSSLILNSPGRDASICSFPLRTPRSLRETGFSDFLLPSSILLLHPVTCSLLPACALHLGFFYCCLVNWLLSFTSLLRSLQRQAESVFIKMEALADGCNRSIFNADFLTHILLEKLDRGEFEGKPAQRSQLRK